MIPSLLTVDQKASVTFDILTSSGIGRYTRLVSQAAVAFGFVERLRTNSDTEFEAMLSVRALELISDIAQCDERSEHEAELAVVVASLALAAPQSLVWLNDYLAVKNAQTLKWVVALLKKLQERSATNVGDVQTQRLQECEDMDAITEVQLAECTVDYRIAA